MKNNENKKSLGLLDATFLVAGSMIGSGIFIVSAAMSKDLGSAGWLLFTWILTGVITLLGALAYGELAAMYPNAGGQFVYIKEAWGKLPSFLYGWTTFAVIQTGVIAAVAVAFGKFLAVFIPGLAEPIVSFSPITISGQNIVGVGIIALLTYSNSRGLNYGKIIQSIFTSAKLIALSLLIIVGIFVAMKLDYFDLNFTNSWDASKTTVNPNGTTSVETLTGLGLAIVISTTIINSLFSSDAWNNVTFIAGDIRNPEKNLPRSLFLGTLIVTILYILANVAYLGLMPLKGEILAKGEILNNASIIKGGIQHVQNSRVGTAAAYTIFGNFGTTLMAILIMISTFGCNNGLIMAGSRLFYAMGKDKLFFSKAASLNKQGIPVNALWIQGIWAMVLCLSGSYDVLIKFATFGSMVFYIVTILGIFKLRKTQPLLLRPYKAFGYPILPAIYILFAAIICVSLMIFSFSDTFGSVIIILLGIPIYYFFTRKNEHSN